MTSFHRKASTKGRTPNTRYFVAKSSSSQITRFSKGFHRALNESHPAFIELSTEVILDPAFGRPRERLLSENLLYHNIFCIVFTLSVLRLGQFTCLNTIWPISLSFPRWTQSPSQCQQPLKLNCQTRAQQVHLDPIHCRYVSDVASCSCKRIWYVLDISQCTIG